MMDYLLYIAIGLGIAALAVVIALIIRRYLIRLTDRRIAAYQNDLMARHLEEVQHIYRQMRGWRHDYHNHIQTMKAHLALGQMDELDAYLGKLDADLDTVDTIVKTGNVMVDAILNSKLSLAKTKHIEINAKATVPDKLTVSEVDLCVIIGNLLDNATEACLKLPTPADRFIRVYMGLLKGQLYLSVSNAVGAEVRRAGKSFVTTKGGSHGFGLMRVDRIVTKYDGFVNRQYEPGVFATEVLLPL